MEGYLGSFFTADNHSVIVTALAWLSKTVPSSGSHFANLVKALVDELDASPAASAETEKEVERQKK